MLVYQSWSGTKMADASLNAMTASVLVWPQFVWDLCILIKSGPWIQLSITHLKNVWHAGILLTYLYFLLFCLSLICTEKRVAISQPVALIQTNHFPFILKPKLFPTNTWKSIMPFNCEWKWLSSVDNINNSIFNLLHFSDRCLTEKLKLFLG